MQFIEHFFGVSPDGGSGDGGLTWYEDKAVLPSEPSLLFTASNEGLYDSQLYVTNGDTPTLTAMATDGRDSVTWLIVDETADAGYWLQTPVM